jgi:hypothetical protein
MVQSPRNYVEDTPGWAGKSKREVFMLARYGRDA